MATRTIEAANQQTRMILRFVAEGSSEHLDAFCLEFNLGGVTIGGEDWVSYLGAFHDVRILSIRLLGPMPWASE